MLVLAQRPYLQARSSTPAPRSPRLQGRGGTSGRRVHQRLRYAHRQHQRACREPSRAEGGALRALFIWVSCRRSVVPLGNRLTCYRDFASTG